MPVPSLRVRVPPITSIVPPASIVKLSKDRVEVISSLLPVLTFILLSRNVGALIALIQFMLSEEDSQFAGVFQSPLAIER